MAGYTNKKNELIEVSREHIDTAIEIKRELQLSSPSGRCSWAKHRKMMEKEGYFDSESSENYRQFIKREQKKRGELPSVEKHADMVADSKLQAIKDEIGEISLRKREAQNNFRELNKLKREWSDRIIFFEEVGKHLEGVSFDNSYKKLEPLPETENTALVNMADWHIGLRTDNFNYDIARQRVEKYAQEVIHYTDVFNINTVHIAGIGDLLNGSYMRPNQMAENEFSFSEQIVKATEIVFEFLQDLSTKLNVVYIGSVIGNHSRMSSGSQNNSIEGDSGENIVDEVIMKYIELSKNKRLTANNKKTSNKAISVNINGVDIKIVHGDKIKKNEKDKVGTFVSTDEIFYDVLLYGHYHHSSYVEENHGRMAIGMGCLQGSTEFSRDLGFETKPSQTILILEGDRYIPIRVELD